MSGANLVYIRRVGVDVPTRVARATLLVYMAALLGAEATAVLFSIEIALGCYAVLLFALLNHVALVPALRPEARAALAALALVPVFKIGAVALPQRIVPDAYWEALPAALALVTAVALRGSVDGLSTWRASPELGWEIQLLIVAMGPTLAVAAAATLPLLDSAKANPTFVMPPVSVLIVAAFSGLTLEVVFRGVVQSSIVRLFGLPGVVLASLLYAGLFVSSGSGFVITLALITGFVWGIVAAVTRTVSGVAASHALFAMTWAAVY